MTRTEVLEKAKAIVEGKREEYPENSFMVTAKLWNTYLKARGILDETRYINDSDVAMLMALLKVARIAGGHYKADSYIDACGYLSWAAELAGEDNDA